MNNIFFVFFGMLGAMGLVAGCATGPRNIVTTDIPSNESPVATGADDAVSELPQLAQEQEIVNLQDGDTYTIEIVEVQKEIGGQMLRMFAYNGSIPGPVLRAPQGSHVTLRVINRISDIETTVHSHGLRGANTEDGVPVEMGGHDDPIGAGEELIYELEFPDEGVFWYHPHVREDLQQEMGLYGNYLIMSSEEAPVNREETVMLDDIFLDRHGEIVPFDPEVGDYSLMGRFGNMPLINGDTNYEITMQQGEVVRLYLTNVANVTPFNLGISPSVLRSDIVDPADIPQMKLIGGDIGGYEREEMIDNLVIAPAERYIVDLYAPDPGLYQITNMIGENPYIIATIRVEDSVVETSHRDQFVTLHENTKMQSDIDAFRPSFDKEIDKTLVLDVEMDGMMGGMGHGMMAGMDHGGSDEQIMLPGGLMLDASTVEWADTMPMMNAASTTDNTRWHLVDKDTGKRDMDIKRSFDQGDIVKVRIYNDPESAHPMQHPVHFHGQRFLVLNKNGVENQNLVWKDTVLVPTGEYVDILIDMSNPGVWMSHCHIAEHLTAGMMMSFEVKEKE